MFRDIRDQLGSFFLFSIIGALMIGLIFLGQHYSFTEQPLSEEQQNLEDGQNEQNEQNEQRDEDSKGTSPTDNGQINDDDEIAPVYSQDVYQIDEEAWLQLDELVEELKGTHEWDQINGVLQMELFDIPFVWVKDVPVVERNGVYLPYKLKPLIMDEQVYLPLSFLEDGLDVQLSMDQERKKASFTVDPLVEETFAGFSEKPIQLEELSAEDMIDYLSFLASPVPGASISTKESHLPGAPRTYRNGYHEGIDWYSGTSGLTIDINTPIVSVADGVVVRADVDYVEMERDEREGYLSWSGQLTDTPTFILDKLRGRSVWVQYDHGVMVRFVHLSRIEEGIAVGERVQRGDILGYVGNSGTSFAINGDEHGGLHLHADLLVYGELFWRHMDGSDEVRRVLEEIFQE
jgi:murein DD-endopeptidase MepM/ murein hydrolase activator NlpD